MGSLRRVLVPLEIDARAPALGAVLHALQGRTMGTRWAVKFSGSRDAALPALQAAVERELDRVVAQMSPWETSSDISRFNRAPAGSWHTPPAEFAQVLSCAWAIASASEGAFDPTAGALVELWGFGPPGLAGGSPTAQAIETALARVGWQGLKQQGGRWQQPGGLTLDLSAIAKGFAVDQVSHVLQQRGIDNHLVEVGGELRGAGLRPDGQPWWVDLQMPPSPLAGGVTRIALHGLCVATSGDYFRHFTDAAGVHRSHTIDPRSGWPVAHGLASVSVVHAECMQADALSTALTVLGAERGMAFACEHGVAAMFVQRVGTGFVETLSPALQALAT